MAGANAILLRVLALDLLLRLTATADRFFDGNVTRLNVKLKISNIDLLEGSKRSVQGDHGGDCDHYEDVFLVVFHGFAPNLSLFSLFAWANRTGKLLMFFLCVVFGIIRYAHSPNYPLFPRKAAAFPASGFDTRRGVSPRRSQANRGGVAVFEVSISKAQ
jgi:hypothetical protein